MENKQNGEGKGGKYLRTDSVGFLTPSFAWLEDQVGLNGNPVKRRRVRLYKEDYSTI